MEKLWVRGGHKLCGNVEIPGAKNSVLPLMAASVLCRGTVTLKNVPLLSDVAASLDILQELGCAAQRNGRTLTIQAQQLQSSSIPEHLMTAMRSSLFYLAPLLARTGRAEITQPGGCKLGKRPIDIHLDGLSAMGACVHQTAEKTIVTAPDGLHGVDYTLRFPSVGATETLLMAAVTASGTTTLHGVACEPEITDLIRFLKEAGAHISGADTSVLQIEGRALLTGATHTICPDRIVAATVLCAVAGCGGEVLLTGCEVSHLTALLPLLQKLGCTITAVGNGALCVASDGAKEALGTIATGVYPAFCTDMSPLLMAAVLKAPGFSSCIDTVFENRFACAKGFLALGAHTVGTGNALAVQGTARLHGAELMAADLRGGAALVLAAMQAQGESTIAGVEYIVRGYEDIAALFANLGAEIGTRQES